MCVCVWESLCVCVECFDLVRVYSIYIVKVKIGFPRVSYKCVCECVLWLVRGGRAWGRSCRRLSVVFHSLHKCVSVSVGPFNINCKCLRVCVLEKYINIELSLKYTLRRQTIMGGAGRCDTNNQPKPLANKHNQHSEFSQIGCTEGGCGCMCVCMSNVFNKIRLLRRGQNIKMEKFRFTLELLW